jgi:hypothetical protein
MVESVEPRLTSSPKCRKRSCLLSLRSTRVFGATLTPNRAIGAFVFPEAWKDLSLFRKVLASFREHGVSAILTESGTYELTAIEAVHDLGLRFYAGIACFSDHAAMFRSLTERPELWPILESGERRPLMEWYIGISPTDRRHQEEILATIRSIAAHPIDGLFLDFVRWPVHGEIELRPGRARPLDSSFDAATLALFEKTFGIVPRSDTVASRAAWIREQCFRAWVDFKCKVVTDFVREARNSLKGVNPQAELGIYVVPDVDGLTESLAGQRLSDLAPLVDWVSPMLYHNILLRRPSWIGPALAEVVRVAGPKTLPVIQADSNRNPALAADWGPPMSDADWSAALAEVAARADIGGMAVFPGASLIGNGRGEALAAMVGEWR